MSKVRMPVVFSAHGSPMNAVRDNAFTRFLSGWGRALPPPRAILAVSAHWEAARPSVTTSPTPETIHDFGGFPRELYEIRYPAAGDVALAERAIALLRGAGVALPCGAEVAAQADPRRGIDHGVWAPLLWIYPEARIPVVQASLLEGVEMVQHLEMGRALAPLRDEGVLIFCSGNVVHNLWAADLLRDNVPTELWAAEFDAWVRSRLDEGNVGALAAFLEEAPNGRLAHPTTEHYEPLLVAAGAAGEEFTVHHPFEGFEHGTLSLRCVVFSSMA